jgi:hypothetical protein
MLLRSLMAFCLLLTCAGRAHAAQSYDNCAGYITTLPTVITTQGVWCMKQDLATAISSGSAIAINTNNVTIDCNDFKLGGLSAGSATLSSGIYAASRSNITVRHCNVRGFFIGINLYATTTGGNVVEDNRLDGNTVEGLSVDGDGSVVRRNLITNTGGSTSITKHATGIATSYNVDVIDNTVSGVAATSGSNENSYGIVLSNNSSGRIIGNGISALVHDGTGVIVGIDGNNANNGHFTVRDNDLSGDDSAGSYGIRCNAGAAGAAKDNLTNGFFTAIDTCANAGGNFDNS